MSLETSLLPRLPVLRWLCDYVNIN
jgi:hypothetical protein